MSKYPYRIALINFFIAAILGLILRLGGIHALEGFNFSYLLHAHSHTALLGWCYLALYLLLTQYYGANSAYAERYYGRLFLLSQLSVIGMLCSFPIQGYGAVSISFSSLQIICSYAFAITLWRSNSAKTKLESLLLKTSLFFLLVSTLGIFALGPITQHYGKDSAWYKIAIQFYLHFQFNGWLLFAVLSLIIREYFPIASVTKNLFAYVLMVLSTLLSFSLPLSWHYTSTTLSYAIGGAGIMQVLAFLLVIREAQIKWKYQRVVQKSTATLLRNFALFSLALRVIMQLSTLWPSVATASFTLRPWTIGFIHLNMLGIVSGFILWLFWLKRIIPNNKTSTISLSLFIISFTITEFILFAEGIHVFYSFSTPPYTRLLLMYSSIGLPFGILGLLLSSLRFKRATIK